MKFSQGKKNKRRMTASRYSFNGPISHLLFMVCGPGGEVLSHKLHQRCYQFSEVLAGLRQYAPDSVPVQICECDGELRKLRMARRRLEFAGGEQLANI